MSSIPDTPCMCTALRRATRAITKQYDEFLKPSGLRITQYSMLANIIRNPGIGVSALAGILMMDQTTVTRNLQVLAKQGFVHIQESPDDQRLKSIQISELGMEKFEQAKPYWQEVQGKLADRMGQMGFDLFLQSLNTVVKQ